MVLEPTYQHCIIGCSLFKPCWNLPCGHCRIGCRLIKRCQYLPTMHCGAGVQAVKVVLEPTYWALCCRGTGCLSGVDTYLPVTVLQGCRLFKQCRNLPAGHCVAEVQAVSAVSEHTCWALCCRVQAVKAKECRLFKWCRNRPAGHCVAGVQAV